MKNIATIAEIQQRLLDMAISVRDILESNNIGYLIAYGTLLGSVRHGGFIPWDDDFDFHVFDEDYDRAVECLRTELPDNLFLEDEKSEPLYFHGWAHVKDLNSEADISAYPKDGVYQHKGLSVDLYRFYKIASKEKTLFKSIQHLEYLKRRLKLQLITKSEFDEITDELNNIINSERTLIPNISEERFSYTGIEGTSVFDVDTIVPLKDIVFNGHTFKGPNNIEEYLSICYDDYMTLPPVNEREPHFKKVILY